MHSHRRMHDQKPSEHLYKGGSDESNSKVACRSAWIFALFTVAATNTIELDAQEWFASIIRQGKVNASATVESPLGVAGPVWRIAKDICQGKQSKDAIPRGPSRFEHLEDVPFRSAVKDRWPYSEGRHIVTQALSCSGP
jgi:hypothetical protein